MLARIYSFLAQVFFFLINYFYFDLPLTLWIGMYVSAYSIIDSLCVSFYMFDFKLINLITVFSKIIVEGLCVLLLTYIILKQLFAFVNWFCSFDGKGSMWIYYMIISHLASFMYEWDCFLIHIVSKYVFIGVPTSVPAPDFKCISYFGQECSFYILSLMHI